MKAKRKTKRGNSAAKDDDGLTKQHKAFADAVLQGTPAGTAYERVGFKSRGFIAQVCASRLLKSAKVVDYMRKERKAAAKAAECEKWEYVSFLGRIIKTPIGSIDENSDLVQEWVKTELGQEVVSTRVKIADKLGAGKQLATLLGWNEPEKVEHSVDDELAEILSMARRGRS